MNLVFGMLSTLLTVTTAYDGIWIPGTSLPRGLCSSAIGYHNNSIYLIGGEKTGSQRSLLEYNVLQNNFTDFGEFYLPQSDAIYYGRKESQHYTQIDHYLYIIDSNSLFRFDLKNKSYDSDWNGVTLPSGSSDGCLASSDELLFIIGGSYGGSVNALNMSNMSWITNISSTIMGRDRLSCIVHPIRKRLFAIGGSGMRSIESLYIGDDQDISTQIWEYLEGSLSDAGPYGYGVHSPSKRSAVYEDDIWVFGGYNYRDMGGRKWYNFEADIAIIDTLSGAVSDGGSVGYGSFGLAPIVFNDFMYVFGGCWSWINDDDGSSNNDEFKATSHTKFSDLLATRAPTNVPTTAIPTIGTDSPTGYPTVSPVTSSPSGSPTTAAPTTGTPTDSPTTAAPTVATDTPTTSTPTTGTNAPT
eukprot:347018_1